MCPFYALANFLWVLRILSFLVIWPDSVPSGNFRQLLSPPGGGNLITSTAVWRHLVLSTGNSFFCSHSPRSALGFRDREKENSGKFPRMRTQQQTSTGLVPSKPPLSSVDLEFSKGHHLLARVLSVPST